MKNIIIFTGAGVSAESGIKTFRDSDGLWEEYNIMDVATPEAWRRQPKVVLEFYNARRKQIRSAQPNNAHRRIADLEKYFDVRVITQNIDDLHERAGSSNVLHLHGEIVKSRSSQDPTLIYDMQHDEITWGEKCERGSQLRPHVVWFGEDVPAMSEASKWTSLAEIFIVIGTSLNVYPAAGLIHYTKPECITYLIDPGEPLISAKSDIRWIREKAGIGMEELYLLLTNEKEK